MTDADPFLQVMDRFVDGLCGKIVHTVDHADAEDIPLIVGTILDAVRNSIANLMLVEYECERLLNRG